jgi:hypothetical protein
MDKDEDNLLPENTIGKPAISVGRKTFISYRYNNSPTLYLPKLIAGMREVLWKILSAEENLPDGLTVEESEAPVGLASTRYKKDVP